MLVSPPPLMALCLASGGEKTGIKRTWLGRPWVMRLKVESGVEDPRLRLD